MGLFSLSDLEYMFYAAIRNGSIGTIGAKGDPGGWTVGTSLGTADLNTITTDGIYRQNNVSYSTEASNYPAGAVGTLGILYVSQASTDAWMMQRYHVISGNGQGRVVYERNRTGSTWNAWRAFPYSRIDQTAGRAIYEWDSVNHREQLTYGDTGFRDLEASVLNNWGVGILKIRRIGYEVYLYIYNVNPASQTGVSMWDIPSGFKPFGPATTLGYPCSGASPVLVTTSSVLPQTSASSCTGYVHIINWTTTEAWPTVLPGVANGAIPNL